MSDKSEPPITGIIIRDKNNGSSATLKLTPGLRYKNGQLEQWRQREGTLTGEWRKVPSDE
jgi:hypothetical protein